MNTATAPGTPAQPAPPAPAAPKPPTTSATLGERMALKRQAILAKSQPAEPEGGTGGAAAEPGGIAPAEPANDVTAAPEAANGNEKAKEPEQDADDLRAAAEAEKQQRRKVVAEAISLRKEKQKLRQMRADQEAREARLRAGEAERAELDELRKRDPIAAARKLGISLKEMVERDLTDEKAKPKVPLEDLPPELRAELEESRKFREEQALKEKEREQREQAAARAAKAAEGEARGQALIRATFDAEREDYPHLSNYFDADTVISSAWQLALNHYTETEEEVDLRKVLSYMEDNARKEREKFSKPLPPKGVPDRASREASQASNPEPKTMSQSDAASGVPSVRVESQAQKRDRIRKRSQSR